MHSGACLTDLDRLDDVRVLHPLAIARLAQKSRNGGAVLAQLLAQYLDSHGPVSGMLRSEYRRGAPLADLALQRIPGDRLTNQVLSWHAANLIAT